MTWKSYAAASGAGLLATYLVSAPPTIAPGRQPSPRVEGVVPSAPSSADIQQQAARLGERSRAEVEYRPPSRNPFRFGGRPAATAGPPARAPEPSEPAVTAIPVPAPPPPIRLSGIVTNTVNGVQRRSAVVSTADGLVTAGEGETAGAYRVVRVDEDAVEVIGPDGVARRLSLRP